MFSQSCWRFWIRAVTADLRTAPQRHLMAQKHVSAVLGSAVTAQHLEKRPQTPNLTQPSRPKLSEGTSCDSSSGFDHRIFVVLDLMKQTFDRLISFIYCPSEFHIKFLLQKQLWPCYLYLVFFLCSIRSEALSVLFVLLSLFFKIKSSFYYESTLSELYLQSHKIF